MSYQDYAIAQLGKSDGILLNSLKRRRDTWDLGISPNEWLRRRSEQLQRTVERNAYQKVGQPNPSTAPFNKQSTNSATHAQRNTKRRPLSPQASTPESGESSRSVTPTPPTPESQIYLRDNAWVHQAASQSAKDPLQRVIFMSTLTQNEHDMLAGFLPSSITNSEAVTIDKLLKGRTVRRSTICGYSLGQETEQESDNTAPEPLLDLEEFLDMDDGELTPKQEEISDMLVLDDAIIMPLTP